MTEWYNAVSQSIAGLKASLETWEVKEMQLDKLVKLARHIDSFGACSECGKFKFDVDKLVVDLRTAGKMNKGQRRSHLGRMECLVSHLQKQHRLVSEGQYITIGLGIGTALGLALGALIHVTAIGVPIGVALGLGIGLAFDARAKKEGRVI